MKDPCSMLTREKLSDGFSVDYLEEQCFIKFHVKKRKPRNIRRAYYLQKGEKKCIVAFTPFLSCIRASFKTHRVNSQINVAKNRHSTVF